MANKEIWRDVLGYEGIYKVSNIGRVKRIGDYRNQYATWKSEKILKSSTNSNKYLFVTLSKDNKFKRKYVHRLVAEEFLPNPKQKETVNHIDSDRTNNNVDNLEWTTYKENNAHAILKMHERGETKRNNKGSKPVIQYDLEGNYIKEYPSVREVYRQTKIYSIEKVCNGLRKTAGGYMWRYKQTV